MILNASCSINPAEGLNEPGVGVNLVVLNGDVVPLVDPDPTLRTVVDLVVVDPDVVPGPGHDAPPGELVGLDQSVLHGLAVSDVIIRSDNLQAGYLYPGDLERSK